MSARVIDLFELVLDEVRLETPEFRREPIIDLAELLIDEPAAGTGRALRAEADGLEPLPW